MLVVPDISEFNAPLTSAYPRDFIIFRVNDGLYQDKHFLTNADEAAALYKAGRIAGVILYTVYRPVALAQQYGFTWNLIGPRIPPWLKGIEVDVEDWQGQIVGDHSAAINALCGMHAHRFGTFNAILGYGNLPNLGSIWRARDPRIRLNIAKYSSQIVVGQVSHAIAQQYFGNTGDPVPRGLPTSTPSLGTCDHDVFPAFSTGRQLAAALAPTPVRPPAPKPPAPKPAPPALYPPGTSALVSANRQYALAMQDDGNVVAYHQGRPIWQSHTNV